MALGRHQIPSQYLQLVFMFSCIPDVFSGITSKLSKYSIVNPQVIHRNIRSSRSSEQSEEAGLSIFPSNLFLLFYFQVHCYYHGEVEGYENSVVALSTCSGLRGVILLGNETFGLEPAPQSATNEHLLYLLKDIQSEPVTCGVVGEAQSTPSHEPFEPDLTGFFYVELVLVVDNQRVILMLSSVRVYCAVLYDVLLLFSILFQYYKQLNIRVVLVGLEIFKDSNPFSVDGSAGEVLGRFVRWRKSTLVPRLRHDVGQLIVGRSGAFGGGVLGMAFVGRVCSVTTGGGINVYSNNALPFASTVVAHEMGHNLGMNHDNSRCTCNGNSCIMGASATGSTTFSRCSAEDFERLVVRGGGVCLRNQPSESDVVGIAECGNGRLEEGEQCDCGQPEECDNRCCDPATCTFTRGSTCAQGDCCNNCQIQVAGTPCRESVNTCDLPEFCKGDSPFCPDDYYVMDGMPCENNAAYCYEGRCQTYDYQCRHLFAPDPARKAADICFSHANTIGDKFGNCGITSTGNYIKCTVANSMCGKVQCTDVDVQNPPDGAIISIQMVDGSTCVNADFNLGPDVLDPAYVNPGSPCDKGKTCLDFQCVNASALLPNLDCEAQTTCNGRGVCNDQGNCHCDDGWAPPNCDRAGPGGSIDSGPAQIDYSLRNGLLIFFLLVVPVLVFIVLALLYIFRRESLDPCLKPRSLNFRYGELDYWNMDANKAPVQSPAPTQGPGVPRPIPPRQEV
uniref:ADAM metallopeptidase domain 9b n=1 Tax=Acanthochromis polyacanthus TaxID=80966 RepID=A0A3Q1GMD2_9TELE